MVDSTITTATLNPFTDSVDTTASYTKGICGEKVVSLGLTAPLFVTVVLDSTDRINNPFKVNYDGSKATEDDVGKDLVIAYTVKLQEYAGILTDYTATFEFKIVCPALVQIKTLTVPTHALNFYDVADPEKSKIKIPTIVLLPGVCFKVESYEIALKDAKLGDLPPEFIAMKSDKSNFEVLTNDRSYVGLHVITIKAVIDNKEKLLEHDF